MTDAIPPVNQVEAVPHERRPKSSTRRPRRFAWSVVAAAGLLLPRQVDAQGVTDTRLDASRTSTAARLPALLFASARRADRRFGDADDEREGAAAIPIAASRNSRPRYRTPGIRELAPGRFAHHRRRHPRENDSSSVVRACRIDRREGADSRIDARNRDVPRSPFSAPRIPVSYRRVASACSTSSGPRPVCRRRRRPVARRLARRQRFRRSARAPTRISFSSTARTTPVRATVSRGPNLGVDFIQEVHVKSIGASAEFGSVQGAVINVITKQGSARSLSDTSYHAQTPA